MANQNATKVALHVSAEGDFTWILDKVTQGRISAAAGVKEVMIAPGPHEITAKNSDGQTIFIHNFTVSPDKQNAVRIVPRAPRAATTGAGSGSSHTMSARTSARSQPPAAEPAPAAPVSYPRFSPTSPDMFVRITPQAFMHATASFAGGRKSSKADGYQINVIAVPVSASQTYYDVKVQMVMKGVGSSGSNIELPDLQPAAMPNSYTVVAKDLGKEAIICYTARPPSEPPQRWTGTYHIQNSESPWAPAAFVPAHEPTLENASDAPCGGVKAEKLTPVTEIAAAPENSQPAVPPAQASLALARGSQLYNAHRYAEARPLLITACEGGAGVDACNSVGFMYQYNMGVASDYAKAREYYLKSCNDDSSFSCNNLATLYRDGLGVPRDPQHALQLFEQGCDAGIAEGCDNAGKMLQGHNGVPQDYRRALDLFKKACDQDLYAGCGDEGYTYAMGIGVPKDLAFAASLFKRACGLGSRNSCFSMGEMYKGGDGVPRDPQKSREYYTKACDMGDQEACGLAR